VSKPPLTLAPPPPPLLYLDNIEAFLGGTRGQITIGRIPPIAFAIVAAEGKKMRAALVGREDETVVDLLLRLDAALNSFIMDGVRVDEVLPEIQRRRAARSK
jgi:hypothetical protein